MEMKPVQSSNIRSIGYDPESKTLRATFINDKTYEYYDVRPEQYEAMLAAESIGRFFARFKQMHRGREIE